MKRAAFLSLLSLPAFVLLATDAFAGDPPSDPKPSPTPAKSQIPAKKTTAEVKSEKPSPALDQLFDKDSDSRHPQLHLSGSAEMGIFVIRK